MLYLVLFVKIDVSWKKFLEKFQLSVFQELSKKNKINTVPSRVDVWIAVASGKTFVRKDVSWDSCNHRYHSVNKSATQLQQTTGSWPSIKVACSPASSESGHALWYSLVPDQLPDCCLLAPPRTEERASSGPGLPAGDGHQLPETIFK